MSIEEIIKALDEIAKGFEGLSAEGCARTDLLAMWEGRAKGIRQAIALIKAHTRGKPNDPLTLEELREMDDVDVWVTFPPDLDGDRLVMHALIEYDSKSGDVWFTNNLGGRSTFDELSEDGGLAYRRKPEEETI